MTAGERAGGAHANSMGLTLGMVVQEVGWDADADEALREEIMNAIDAELIEDADEAVDVVLLWWREADGDVADGLVDALTDLSSDGCVWLMTPKVGRAGHVDASEVAEGALTAGLALTRSVTASAAWQASRLVRPKGNRK